MKKLIASAVLGTLLVAGFFFTYDDNQSDLAMDREPSIYSISKSSLYF